MSNIKILDTTLRDGGYLNNWEFGENSIKEIIYSLFQAKIDYVECGFLYKKNIQDTSLYKNISDLKKYNVTGKCSLMLNLGSVDIDNIQPCENLDFEIRVAFKKHDLGIVQEAVKILDKKGIKYSLNPMHTSLYSPDELRTLIDIANSTNPICFTVVDTMGIMTPYDTKNLFVELDRNVKKSVCFGFHSHNNLNLSMDNIIEVQKLNIDREIIIDSCLGGIGRGGGIISTEVLSDKLNKDYSIGYNVALLKDVSEQVITPIVDKLYIKEKYPYYLSAKHKCHPNYATYCVKNGISEYAEIDNLLARIPEENKTIFSPDIIKNIMIYK